MVFCGILLQTYSGLDPDCYRLREINNDWINFGNKNLGSYLVKMMKISSTNFNRLWIEHFDGTTFMNIDDTLRDSVRYSNGCSTSIWNMLSSRL